MGDQVKYTPRGGLSVREREVLALAAEGMSNFEIAEKLFIGEDTIKTHMRRINLKLGSRNRTHMVGIGYHLGILGDHRQDLYRHLYQLGQVTGVLIRYGSARSEAPPGSRFAVFYDALASALSREAPDAE